jgi:WD40 repeat protein
LEYFMNSKIPFLLKPAFILILTGWMLSACNLVTPVPLETETPEITLTPSAVVQPTQAPTVEQPVETQVTPTEVVVDPTPTVTAAPEVISPENAGQLQEVDSIAFDLPERLDWSADSQRLAVISRSGTLLYDAANQSVIETMTFGDPEGVLDACADNSMAATTEDQMEIRLYSVQTGAVVHNLETQGILYQASFSPDGGLLAIPLMEEIAVELYDTQTGEAVRRLTGFETAAPVYGAVFSSNGENIIWISRGRVQLMNIATGALRAGFSHQEFVSAVALAPDDSVLAVSTAATVNDEYTPVIQLWHPGSGADLGILIPGDEIPSAIDISPASDLLVNSFGSSIQLWDLDEQAQISSTVGHTDRVTALIFSPNGRTLATASSDGWVRLWQVRP